ncbi:unnamed protein product [Cylicocyclus nassatus]|uniref:EF-hand domain-containing protein n=1 Tax=Cylicocyclus nassatus TaxID=53992 RepID=A0AA36M789_CYLNA|nr:unnamed protein product [Cylicocyclus nassatus]
MKRIWSRCRIFARDYRFNSGNGRDWRRLRSASAALTTASALVAYQGGAAFKKNDVLGRDERERYQVHTDHKLTKRELRFLEFASIEYDDVIYMSPMDFIDSLTLDSPRERVYRRVLKDGDLKKMLRATPPFRLGSKDLFRTLDQNGLISYSEYIFLLTLITKSKSAFKIAFLMFDKDDNGRIDKDEFLLIRSLTSSLRSTRGPQQNRSEDPCQLDISDFQFMVSRYRQRLFEGSDSYALLYTKSEDEVKKQDTTLLLHLFGMNGNGKLSFEEFRRFYENLQEEIMEIEFHEFARGKPTISPMDFARLVLRYTIVHQDDYHTYISRVKERTSPDDKGVTLSQ